ncbi:folate-binding protein YgfZ [Caldichromatium japonicum]|uniref:Folate-binding protein YgfZ n=1 Tax=Caldichromatium japonicum TaxID=2699430 RepID=A0A6G7VBS3_9GAMM|nr:folate-binding protein YgfZ [Caldichromatium japonicum]QIK37509.1 folate-binding protein YgfZ [Caldichromatium japonicum]
MTNQWGDFLQTRFGASIDEFGVVHFPEPSPAADCQLFDLSHLGLIAAVGPDAAEFLQGQLTNDVRELSNRHTHLTAHCSHKGRVIALFRAMRLGETFYLQAPAELIAPTLERLRRFVLRSKLSLNEASAALVRIGVAGHSAADLLSRQGLPIPERDNGLERYDALALIRLPAPVPRFELLGPFAEISALWQALIPQASPAQAGDWRRLDIEAGLPNVYERTSELFVPQMLNLQLIDGVSFHKGCYTGQEVVARMQFLGRLKRRMYLAEVECPTPPQPGDELFAPASTSQQTDGWVVDAYPLTDVRHLLLAVAEIAAVEAGEIRLGPDGPPLRLREPPYGFADTTR